MVKVGMLLVAVAAGMSLTGCGESAPGPAATSSPTPLPSLLETPTAFATSQRPLGEAGDSLYGSFVIPPEQLKGALDNATAEERPILEDGVITFSEYETARLEAIACLEEGGLAVKHYPFIGRHDGDPLPGPMLTSRGEYVFFAAGKPGQTHADGRRVWDGCTGTTPTVDFYWTAIHTQPTEVERQQHRDAIAACLRASGHDAPEHPSKQDLAMVAFPPDGVIAQLNQPEWFLACHNKANDDFAIYSVWHGN